MLKNKTKILIFSLSIFLIPFIAHGASLVMACYETGDCGFCDALNLVTKIANYLIGISGVAALLMFLYAGLTLITSKGNSSKITTATKIMINAVIGMFVLYIAWAGVNYLIYTLTDGQQTSKGVATATIFTKSWQTFTCEKKITGPIDWHDVAVPTNNGSTSTVRLSEVTLQTGNACARRDSAGYGGFNPFTGVYGDKTNQDSNISPELGKVLVCMQQLLTAGAGENTGGDTLSVSDITITSISDSTGIENCVGNKYVACSSTVTTNCCHHSKNSCHYGGLNYPTPAKSYAVDIRSNGRTSDENTLIKQLIEKAGGRYHDETPDPDQPHHHMSVDPCDRTY